MSGYAIVVLLMQNNALRGMSLTDNNQDSSGLLAPPQAARYLGVKERTIYLWV